MAKDKYQIEKDLEKFQDLSGVSVRQMNIGLWFSENRLLLTRLLTIFLILISAFFFIYSTYAYIIYFMSEPIDNQLENQVMSPRMVVTQMEPGPVQVFKSGDAYDLAVNIINENDNFWAGFDYCFYQQNKAIYCDNSFVLPSENRFLSQLGMKLIDTSNLSFKIEDIFWSRINRREIADWQSYFNERINFIFSDVTFFNAVKSGLSENMKLNSLEFTFFNDSAYSYYQIDFDVLFYAGSNLVGVQKYLGENVKTGETRPVKLSWPGDLSSVSQVKIVPRVNLMSDSVYLKYQDIVF
ncbi:MAG TPA: hypothetical protein VFD51_01545 [Patescibacteria group bacterium]|nr:hypothetical protein [Patescibacteria group bacterium]